MDGTVMPDINGGRPFVRITEQPASRALRFRYPCEGRYPGTLVGVNSSNENKTHPTIQIYNYTGKAVVVVSCVTKDAPYRPHPHHLVGRDSCKNGICVVTVDNQDMTYSFTGLGIQCVRRKDIEQSLEDRKKIRVDPFRTGFAHKDQAGSIDLNAVRLCFQVFIENSQGECRDPLSPVVSDVIYDRKTKCDLTITRLSHFSAPVTGGQEIILLCDRVTKDDIQVWFVERINDKVLWEEQAELLPNGIHKQVAICFKTPRYRDENVDQPKSVFIEMRRPSDRETSEAKDFILYPSSRDPERLEPKRKKTSEGYLDSLMPNAMSKPAITVPRMIRQVTRRSDRGPSPMQEGATGGAVALPDLGPSTSSYSYIPASVPTTMPQPQVYQEGPPIKLEHATFAVPVMPIDHQPVMLQNCGQEFNMGEFLATSVHVDEVEATTEKFHSLELETALSSGAMEEIMGSIGENNSLVNLSASIFDSGNIGVVPMEDTRNSTSSMNLATIHNQLDALNDLSNPSFKNES